jgi:hypothetical protein
MPAAYEHIYENTNNWLKTMLKATIPKVEESAISREVRIESTEYNSKRLQAVIEKTLNLIEAKYKADIVVSLNCELHDVYLARKYSCAINTKNSLDNPL